MRILLVPVAAAAFLAAAPAVGQNVGMQVTDPSGGVVGTVTAIKGGNLLVKTDKHEVELPKTSFTAANGKLLFGMTQAQLDAQIEQSLASAQAALVAGATVKSADGAQLGKVDSVADGKVVIALDSGGKVAIPQEGARGDADGTVTVGYTAAQLKALGSPADEAPAPAAGS